MKSSVVILFIILFCTVLFAQAPDTVWTKTFGGNDSEVGISIQQTYDGGYVIIGERSGKDWLIKTDADGDTLWTKSLIGNGHSIQQTSDGGYIITGDLNSDVLLVKTDANGDTLWTKIFNGHGHIPPINDWGNSIDATSDGGYVIAGRTRSASFFDGSIWLIKTNANGDSLWSKSFGDGDGSSVKQTSDGGYIIAGYTLSSGADVRLIKTDNNGDTLWTKTFGGDSLDYGNSVQRTTDGGYVATGFTASFGSGGSDVWLIKTDDNGDTMWTKTFGGSLGENGNSVQQTFDGGYIITGYTRSFGAGNSDVWIIKTNANGDTMWTKTIGDSLSDGGVSVQQTYDSGYIITGWTESFGAGDRDVWLIKVAPDITAIEEPNTFINDYQLQQNYPNPFNPATTIEFSLPQSDFVTLKIYNILGEEVATLVSEKLAAGKYRYEWDAGELASGLYISRLKAGDFTENRKMIVLR